MSSSFTQHFLQFCSGIIVVRKSAEISEKAGRDPDHICTWFSEVELGLLRGVCSHRRELGSCPWPAWLLGPVWARAAAGAGGTLVWMVHRSHCRLVLLVRSPRECEWHFVRETHFILCPPVQRPPATTQRSGVTACTSWDFTSFLLSFCTLAYPYFGSRGTASLGIAKGGSFPSKELSYLSQVQQSSSFGS